MSVAVGAAVAANGLSAKLAKMLLDGARHWHGVPMRLAAGHGVAQRRAARAPVGRVPAAAGGGCAPGRGLRRPQHGCVVTGGCATHQRMRSMAMQEGGSMRAQFWGCRLDMPEYSSM
eukprot:161647-Chlamydomonas_euryale.AAC.3